MSANVCEDPRRWAVVGSGNMARRMASTLRDHPRADLAGFVTGSVERGASLEAEFGVPVVADLALLEVDAVYVASVSTRHAVDVLTAIDAGHAVLAEKPLGVTDEEVRSLQRASTEAGVFLMEGMWSRFLPVGRALAARCSAGDYDDASLVVSTLGYRVDRDPTRRWFGDAGSGGVLLDLGVYGLDAALQVLGPPVETVVDAVVVDDVVTRATIIGAHAGDARSVTTVSFDATIAGDLSIACPQFTDVYVGEFQHAHRLERHISGRVDELDLSFPGEGLAPEIDEVHRQLAAGSTESEVLPQAATAALHDWLAEIRAQVAARPVV